MRRAAPWAATVLALHAVLCARLSAAPQQTADAPADFTLCDLLNRTWRNECVRFPLSGAQAEHVRANHALVDQDGGAVAYQSVPGPKGGAPRIAFTVDLDPFQTRTWRFADAPASADTDLTIEETDELIRVVNSHTGVAVRKTLKHGQGPIAGVRRRSGVWCLDSVLRTPQPVFAHSATVSARGAVFVEVACVTEFADGGRWELTLRVQAGEPVVLASEHFRLAKSAEFSLKLDEGFSPDSVLFRRGKGERGKVVGLVETLKLAEISDAKKFVLQPWLQWWVRRTQGNWFGLYEEGGSDLLALGAYAPSLWVDPEQDRRLRPAVRIPLVLTEEDGLAAAFELKTGARKWLLAALDQTESLEVLAGKDRVRAPLPQRFLIKHGNFPLDKVRDYVLEWTQRRDEHPRLFLRPEQLAEHRRRYEPDEAAVARLLKIPIRVFELNDALYHHFGAPHPELEAKLVDLAVNLTQRTAERLLSQNDLVTFGFAPHHQKAIENCAALADAVLNSDMLTDEAHRRLLAQLAFLGYAVNSPDYWSPERGFCANPNMTTTVAAFQTVLGALLGGHPLAKTWLASGMRELERQLEAWSGPNGGWLEAPHYAMASYDCLIGYFLMAYNAGFSDRFFSPRMKNVALWLAKIATPPDARVQGLRHWHPIGNSYRFEPSGAFGPLAYLWRERDPEFSANLQWMHQQQGSRTSPGVGGFFSTLAGYRRIFHHADLPATAPSWGSELFPSAGVVLRHAFPSDRETQLYMIAGKNHAHYDKDSGSVVIWGKGRVIADDFGYQGHMPGDDHSMLVSPAAPDHALMTVAALTTADDLDCFTGRKLSWTRQVALAKDRDPLAPNFFVIRDSLKAPAPAAWRLWLVAAEVETRGDRVLAVGQADVDTDIFFAGLPDEADVSVEVKERKCYGLDADGRYGRQTYEQKGLTVSWQRGAGLTAIVHPRLKGAEQPRVAPLTADGRAVRIDTPAGTDHVFVGARPFTYRGVNMEFEGTIGRVKVRNGETSLALGAPGRLAANGKSISRNPELLALRDLGAVLAEEFELDAQAVFKPNPRLGIVAVADEPVPAPAAGTRCLKITLDKDRGHVGGRQLFLDTAKSYRISFDCFIPGKASIQFGGYGSDASGKQLKRRDGKRVWQYSLWTPGPHDAWQHVETTLGPAGSGAKCEFLTDIVTISSGAWLRGAPGDAIYVDNFVIEEVE